MSLYDGGSDIDDLLISVTGNSAPSLVTSLRNQIFIMFTTNSNEIGKGFTAKFTFGNKIIKYQIVVCTDLYCAFINRK